MLYEIANSGKTLYAKVNQNDLSASFYRKNSSGLLDELTYISFSAGNPKYARYLCDTHLPFVDGLPPTFGRSTFYPFNEMMGLCGEAPQLGVKIFDNSKIAFLAIKIRSSCVDIIAPWQILLNYTPVKAVPP